MRLAWRVVGAPAPIGAVVLGVGPAGVVLVSFGAGRDRLDATARRLGAELVEDDELTGPVAAELTEYLAGARPRFSQPLDWRLTSADQHVVLRTLYETVGYGETITYGELAERSGAYAGPDSRESLGLAGRRVGSIMGSNPLPVLVPCHRVLAADGLGGFGGGLEAKRWLLSMEGALPPMLDLWSN